MRIPEYTTLVMSGGGIRGIGLLGGLQYLADRNRLHRIRKYIGTSVGSIIGYLVAIGYSPIEIMIHLNQRQLLETFVNALNVMDLIHHGGAVNFYVLHEFLEDMTIAKIGHVLTLQQLQDEFGKELVCCAYNYDRRTAEYLGPKTFPNMPCLTALRMSSTLPFVFHPFTYEGCLYLDGAMVDTFPVSQLTEEDVALAIRLGKKTPREGGGGGGGTSGLVHGKGRRGGGGGYATASVSTKSGGGVGANRRKPFQLLTYLLDILYIPIEHLHRLLEETCRHRPCDTIRIELEMESFQWSLSMAERFDAFSMGYDTFRRYYQPNYIIPVHSHALPPNVPTSPTLPSC